jgi:nicotinate-nucleotide adenylyltransferase
MEKFVPERLGILGGTFNPIHYGHLRIAETLREVYALDEVRLIPTGIAPHRASPNVTDENRLSMTARALASAPQMKVDDREIRRKGVCYTIDTLNELKQAYPEAALVWLVGTDAFVELMRWHRWEELLEIAHLAVAYRPGLSLEDWQQTLPEPLKSVFETRLLQQKTFPYQIVSGKISLLPAEALEISATWLRTKAQEGRSLRFLTPAAVINYIEEHGLYR